LCLCILLAASAHGLFRCPKPGMVFTEDGCSTCHICHDDLTPTSLPTCENGTMCDLTTGLCEFKEYVVCPSDLRIGWHRTVVLIEREPEDYDDLGEQLFLRGGISDDHRSGCTQDARTSDCALDIRIRSVGHGELFEQYNAFKTGDMKLDFYGAEFHQGTYNGVEAAGTPMFASTEDDDSPSHNKFNTYGDNYWVVDMEMDCEQTENGWFEVRAVTRSHDDEEEFEEDIEGGEGCDGNIGGIAPYASANHMARCGFVNVFHFGEAECQINTVSSYDTNN